MRYLILLLFINVAYADDPHYYQVEKTVVNKMTEGVALSIAMGQGQCDLSSDKWQASLGVGHYEDNNALAAGICKGYNGATLSGKIGMESNKIGFGFGASWKF